MGGLKGLCGSLAVSFVRRGAKYITVMGRSGFDDKASKRIIRNIEARECQVNLIKGDVTILEDVRRAFRTSAKPVGGIVQGAMVVRVSDEYNVIATETDFYRAKSTPQ